LPPFEIYWLNIILFYSSLFFISNIQYNKKTVSG